MSLIKEFRAFAVKGNVIDLAVAVVIGAAFTKIVNAIVAEIMMPLVGRVLPGDAWTSYTIADIRIGVVLGAILEFLIVAAVLFAVVVKFMGAMRRKQDEPPPPSRKTCEDCLEEIPAAARRCRACASPQPA
jgi:large conductance mechanosensitive channel